jgi:cell division protein FtsN
MLFGLGIGLIVALGVYLNGPRIIGARRAAPVTMPVPQDPDERDASTRAVDEPADTPARKAAETAASASSRGAGENDTEDPGRFSFYDLLPSFEVVVPEVETPAARSEQTVEIEQPGIYMLQAGSFLTGTEAEAQRARLGLLGIESRIQRVTIDDRAFHRVRIGPIEDLEELNSVRSRLQTANVDSMIMRIDP